MESIQKMITRNRKCDEQKSFYDNGMHASAKVLCSNGFKKYEKILIFCLKWKTLLVLENASIHNTIN